MTSLLIAWIARNGDPHGGDAEFRLCLLRTLKTASHETGHMFSMQHCTLYECNMCGSNHREEADRRPLWLCLHCLAKLCHATGADPIQRFKDLAAFSKRAGLKTEQEFYEKSLALLDDANCAVARHRQVSSWRRHAAVHADVIKPRLTRGWTPQPAVSHFTLGSLRQGPVQIEHFLYLLICMRRRAGIPISQSRACDCATNRLEEMIYVIRNSSQGRRGSLAGCSK